MDDRRWRIGLALFLVYELALAVLYLAFWIVHLRDHGAEFLGLGYLWSPLGLTLHVLFIASWLVLLGAVVLRLFAEREPTG